METLPKALSNSWLSIGIRNAYAAACHTTWFCGQSLRWALKLILVAYFLFCLVFLVLRYAVLPNINHYKATIEQQASKTLGRKVSIASLRAYWVGFNPKLDLRNVIILDQLGKPGLVLPEISTTVSWWSLATGSVRFAKIEVTHPIFDVARQLDGSYFIAGFFVDPDATNDGKGADWVLSQHEIVVRHADVRWLDEQDKTPQVNFTNVNFILKNQWRHHRFALQAVPPASLAAPMDLRGDFQHPVFSGQRSDFSQWTGELYTDLHQADLAVLKRFVDFHTDIKKGFGTLRAWVKIDHGRIHDVTADVNLLDVEGRLRKDLPLLDMTQMSGRLIASEKNTLGEKILPGLFGQVGHSLSLIDFSMIARDGMRLPATTVKETYRPAKDGEVEKIELYAKLLDLQTLANFVEHLPLPADQRQMLKDFSPKGQLKEFTAQWEGTYPHLASYRFKGEFHDLSLNAQAAQLASAKIGRQLAHAAMPAIPGFEHLSGRVDASDKGGSFSLDSQDLVLQLPSYFIEPTMPFNFLKMKADWQFLAQDKLLFRVSDMSFQQEAFTGRLSGQHIFSMRTDDAKKSFGVVDIAGQFTGFDVKKIARFIPADAPEDLRHWLSNALVDGRLDEGIIKIKGDLAQFPYVNADGKPNGQGEFLIRGKIADGKLDFAPGLLADDAVSRLWPMMENIQGSILFDHARMEIRGDTASTMGVNVAKVSAIIPDLMHPGSLLNIEGDVSGNLQAMLQYITSSPVGGWLGHFLENTKASGGAQLNLKLALPLTHLLDARANGVLQLMNNDLVLQPGLPLISALNGKLEFNERGVSFNALKANLLGGTTIASGSSQKDGSVKVRIDGNASSDGIRKALPAASAEKLNGKLVGISRYAAQITVRKKQLELLIESNLQGLALNLPAPLRKTSNDVMPLRFEMNPIASNELNVVRDELKLSLGGVVNARYLRRKELDRNAVWQVLSGGIGVNANLPNPDIGLHANIDFASINLDEWQTLIAATSNASAALAANTAALDLSAYIEPDVLAVHATDLRVMGKKIENVIFGASRQRGAWQANIDSTQASGFVTWDGRSTSSTGNLTARLSRLIIPQSAASDVTDLLVGKNTTTHIPSIDIVADEFELFNKKFGRLELRANNITVEGGHEWRINKLSLINDDAEFKGTGNWINRSGDAISSSSLNCQLNIHNAGNFLERMGFPNVVRGGKGKLEGDLRWNGVPYSLDSASLSGQIRLDMGAGQFLKVDPGAAKLLGVLSMQSLPRRLTLDFRDVFSDGFAFDSLVGTAQIAQGIATTDNLKMRSVNATVLMDGTADIAKETQNLHVAVIPEINAGTASVMYALAVNPAIGLGTFLAQLFLREPLARAFTYEYQVTGSWKDPNVSKYDNKPEAKPAAAQPVEVEKSAKESK